jgi:ABC-type dipeptide/oligopeptide/nickel transport system permease component
MVRFFVNRIGWLALVLFAVSIITFVLMHQVPGGPFDREKSLPAAVIKTLEEKYNLDAPLPAQYVRYIGDILIPRLTSGEQPRSLDGEFLINVTLPFGDGTTLRLMNFGPSYARRARTVSDIFRENLPVSAQLGVTAILVASCIGIPLGILSAVRRGTPIDHLSMGFAILGVSVSSITLGPLLRYLFGVQFKVLPPTGWGTAAHLIMPAFTLGIGSAALLARLTRASLLQVLNEDYIRTARAKGLHEPRVVFAHALKNALTPVVTIYGPFFAAVVTGTFAVEEIFAIPGMGRYFVSAVNGRDYPVIMGTILLYAFLLVVSNFIIDLVYVWIDPRIRFD